MLAMMMASVMPISAKEQYVDPIFGDTIDRTAEDFVTVSLLVADPGTYLYSVLGHACLRMQCPTFGLDYCFTYESEIISNRLAKFFAGDLKMGLFAIPTKDYCEGYRMEGRGVYEYKLNLPANIEQKLWRILDEQVAKGSMLPYDYLRRGCSIACINFVNKSLGNIQIQYNYLQNDLTIRDYAYIYMAKYPWVWFVLNFICGVEIDQLLPDEQQLVVPLELVKAWQNATIDGKPVISTGHPIVLVNGSPQLSSHRFTPMLLALLILCLSIANLFWSKPYFDWIMLAAQTIVGAFMMYLICFSDLCCTSWNWLIIPFNILPAIFWYWRKWWALPCACALLIWCGVMAGNMLWGHVLVDWSHIMLVLAWTLVLIKQSLARTAQ